MLVVVSAERLPLLFLLLHRGGFSRSGPRERRLALLTGARLLARCQRDEVVLVAAGASVREARALLRLQRRALFEFEFEFWREVGISNFEPWCCRST